MRYAGLCSILLLMPAACDDAVGAGYAGGTSGQVMTPAADLSEDTLDADDPKAETEASVADAAARAADMAINCSSWALLCLAVIAVGVGIVL